jgi:hypothetical protein
VALFKYQIPAYLHGLVAIGEFKVGKLII